MSVTQQTEVIQTHLDVKLVEDHLNNWTSLAGTADLNVEVLYSYPPSSSPFEYEQGWWGYRGQAAMVKLASSIYRVRVGDGTASDRQIYEQTITDPTIVSQWTTWTLKYSGVHYGIELYVDAGVAHIVHSKSDGVYLDNTKKTSHTGVIRIHRVGGNPKAIHFITVAQDALDSLQVMAVYYTADISAATPTVVFDVMNYRYQRIEMVAMKNGTYAERLQSCAYYSPSVRNSAASDDLVYVNDLATALSNSWTFGTYVQPIVPAAGRAGVKSISRLWMSDDLTMSALNRAYVFYTTRHVDNNSNYLSNLHSPIFFQQTGFFTDGLTEPFPLGFSVWGLAGAVEWNTELYMAGNGGVWYRTLDETETDLSNYALSAELNIPRDNQQASGTIVLANPDDSIGALLGMTTDNNSTAPEKRLRVKVCQKRSDVLDWEDTEVDDWWIAEAHRVVQDNVKHIELRLGDFWHRLENPFRDSLYFPGHIDFTDWYTGGTQSLLNYYTPTGSMSLTGETDADGAAYNGVTVSKGYFLYTGWKGAHGYININIKVPSAQPQAVVFRWVDANNYWRAYYSLSGGNWVLRLQQCVNGTTTTLATSATLASASTNITIEVDFRFGYIRCYFAFSLVITYQETGTGRADQYGFVGGWAKGNNAEYTAFEFSDNERNYKTSDLIKFLLIYCGYLQFTVDADTNDQDQLAISYGPQTDTPSPAAALEKLLESNFLQVVWGQFSDLPKRGEINVKQFDSTDPVYEIEEEIIEVSQADISDKRANVFSVDGEEDSWTEYSRSDLGTRGAPVNAYYDLPELLSLSAVRAKAQEEKTKSVRGNSLGGVVVWRPWFQRMDIVTWIDHDGNEYTARIEGMNISVDQGVQPYQRVEMDLSPTTVCDPQEDTAPVLVPADFIAQDDFERAVVTSSWGTAIKGGTWTLSGTAANFDLTGSYARIIPTAISSNRFGYLPIASTASMYIAVQANNAIMPSGGASTYIHVLWRVVDASNFYYCALRVFESDGHCTLGIYKRVAGVDTTIVSPATVAGLTIYSTSSIHFKVWVSGTSPTQFAVKVWKGGTEPDTYSAASTDSQAALQAASGVGIGIRLSSDSTTGASVTFDDFEVSVGPTSNPA